MAKKLLKCLNHLLNTCNYDYQKFQYYVNIIGNILLNSLHLINIELHLFVHQSALHIVLSSHIGSKLRDRLNSCILDNKFVNKFVNKLGVTVDHLVANFF